MDPGEGVAVAAVRIAAAQARAGLRVVLAASCGPDAGNELTRELDAAGVVLEAFPFSLRRKAARSIELARLRKLVTDADVVHAHGFYEKFLRQGLREAENAFRILSPHGMLTRWSLSRKRLKKSVFLLLYGRRLLARLSAVHFCSKSEEASTLPVPGGVPRWTLPLPYEAQARGTPDTANNVCAEADAAPTVIYVGRVVSGKGVDRLIEAFARVRHPTARLRIVGGTDGDYGGRCRNLAAASGRAERITFTGRRTPDEVEAELRGSDLFVLPSAHENFGQAAVEAMSASLPCLLSSGVALRDEEGAAAVTADAPREPAALAEAIDRWLADAPGRRELGVAAAAWVADVLSVESVGAAWKSRLRVVLDGRPTPSGDRS